METKKTTKKMAKGEKQVDRLAVLKTYKIFIGGKFPRTESGRYYKPVNQSGDVLGNICLGSRKDLRNAVVAARSAFAGWSGRTAYNRSQILYRIAEMLETRKAQFVEELVLQSYSWKQADKEVDAAVEALVYYAGWADKYQQVFGSVNPVSGSFFNFSAYEPTGVVGVIAPESSALLGLVNVIAPAIVGGNTVVVLASENMPLSSVTFSEVLATSDVPGGVVNIITGKLMELSEYFASHMDVNATVYARADKKVKEQIQQLAVRNLKRVMSYVVNDWTKEENLSPYKILDLQEVKTTWHPVEVVGASGSGY